MPKFYLPPLRHTPASGITPRPVPAQMAPERCITRAPSVGHGTTMLVGRDLTGVVRIKLELATDDLSPWLLKVIRHWLAWQYGAVEMKLVR